MMADMDDDVALRLAAEADLAIVERLTQDPVSTGEFAWLDGTEWVRVAYLNPVA